MKYISWNKYLPGFILTRLEGRKELHEVIRNTGWMMVDQFIRQGVGIIIGIWLARYLGPELYGEYSFAFAVVAIYSPLATLGLGVVAIRRMVKTPEQKDTVIGTAFLLMIAGGIIAIGFSVISVLVIRPDDQLIHWLVVIFSFGYIFQSFTVIEYWFSSQIKWKYVSITKSVTFLTISLVKVCLIFISAPLIAFAWASLIEVIFVSTGLILAYRVNEDSILKWMFSWSMAKNFLHDCWPILFLMILGTVHLRIDQIMLGKMLGNVVLGKYSVAVKITESWYFIPMIICSSSFPVFLKNEKNNPEVFNTHLQKLYKIMVFVAYIFAILITLFSRKIIDMLFDDAYLGAGPILAVLIWSGVFSSLAAARNTFIFSKNWTKINLLSGFLGCALNFLLNVLLIPRYGAMGAVFSTVFSYWFTVHGTCFLFKPLRQTGLMITKALFYPKVW